MLIKETDKTIDKGCCKRVEYARLLATDKKMIRETLVKASKCYTRRISLTVSMQAPGDSDSAEMVMIAYVYSY
jgi:hypothetical protein